jgi:hypothetical protein
MESAASTTVPPETTAPVAVEVGRATTPRLPGKKPRIPRLKKWTPIIVTWIDAVSLEGPQHSDTSFECVTRHSIGHFLKRSAEIITIAMEDDRSVDEASDCDSVTSIPLGMIRKITVLVPKQD